MRLARYILLLWILSLTTCANALPAPNRTVTVSGFIKDSATSVPIIGAQVSVVSLTNNFTSQTDPFGKYSIKINVSRPSIAMIRVYKTGYQPIGKFVLLMPGKSYTANFSLKDIRAPIINGLSINSGALYTNKRQVFLTIDAKDDESGLSVMSFSNDNRTWSSQEPYNTAKAWQITVGDGPKTVHTKVKDKAGNWSKSLSGSITYKSNSPSIIEKILPDNNMDIIKGAIIEIQVVAKDPDNDPIECRFMIDENERQTWSSSNKYLWITVSETEGTHVVTCEVRDKFGEKASQSASYFIKNLTAEEILQKAADNYGRAYDFRAETTLSSTFNGQPFGEVEYCMYYFMKPNKEKTETYANAQRQTQTDNIIILNGSNMYLVNPSTKEVETVDLLFEADINAVQFSQMDIYYNLANFLNAHSISKNDPASDYTKGVVAIDAIPNQPNNLYNQLRLLVDFNKGLIVKSLLYKENNLIQIIATTEFIQMPNGAWLPKTMTKQPILSSGEFVTTMKYDNISVNLGLTELDFDPNKQ